MKGLRKAALGLAVVACVLTAVPTAQAGQMETPLMLASHSAGIGGWMARVARWLGWEGLVGPRATTAAARTGSAPGPVPQGDCTGGVDPTGGPCRP